MSAKKAKSKTEPPKKVKGKEEVIYLPLVPDRLWRNEEENRSPGWRYE